MVAPNTPHVLAGRYIVEREIGRGGMATVYAARDTTLDRTVAVKLLRPELVDRQSGSRFLREIRLTGTLQHPRIVPLLDAGAEGDQLYCVLPYLDGGTLRDRLNRERQLPIADAIAIAKAIAEALHYAHKHGMIHRDVKPENILFTGDEPHLADFGIARALERVAGDSSTSAGIVRGTVAYMSPEQASGDREYDGRSDLFSLGCVLYEMIAGVPAFTGPTVEALLAQRMLVAPRDPRIYRPTVPRSLRAVMSKALAIVPADRFRSAAEMAEALGRVGAGLSDHGSPARSRRPTASVAALAGVITLGAVGAWYAWRPPTSSFDDSLVAVAPFEIYDARLALWREGFMDILAGTLDGAGRIRTVSPTVVGRRWKGGLDATSGADLARATRARYVVLGRVVDAGPDSIRALTSVLDARSGRERAMIDLREQRDRPDRLADSLSVRLIAELGESIDRRTRLRSLGAASPLALKAFLRGEYYLRRTQWDSAAEAYAEAIVADSTFALANWRMKTAAWSRSWGPDTVGNGYALAAGRLNRGLAPRESLLITVDSLWASLPAGDRGVWRRMQRLRLTLDEAARRYPDDPWVWYKIGEARWHLPFGLDYPLSEHLAAFDRAIALDSGFALAYVTHAVELALVLHGPDRARRYARGYDLVALPGVEDSAAKLTERLLDPALARASETTRVLEQSSADVLYRVAANLDMWFDEHETATRVARQLGRARTGTTRFLDRETVQLRLARILALRGHLRESWEEIRNAITIEAPSDEAIELLADLARLGAIPTAVSDSMFNLWLRNSPRGAIFALRWWADRRDEAALTRAAKAFDAWARDASQQQLGLYGARSARAYVALVRGDTAAARRDLALLSDSLCADCYLNWMTRAELAFVAGDLVSAKRQLERVLTYAWNVPTYPLASFLMGRVAERGGESEAARRAYQVVVDAWAHADPLLDPYRTQALAGTRRLDR